MQCREAFPGEESVTMKHVALPASEPAFLDLGRVAARYKALLSLYM